MLEYVFFDERPYRLFLDFLEEQGLSPESNAGEGTYEVRLPDDLDDPVSEMVEAEYDRLFEMNRELYYAESEAGKDNYHMAGLVLHLKDGAITNAYVPPAVLAKILEAVTLDELDVVLKAVVQAVEEPDARSFCKRVRDGDGKFGK